MILLRLVTYWTQSLSLLAQFLNKDIIYLGQPFIMGSTDKTIDPKEFNTGNILYKGQPLTIIVKE